MNTLKAPPPAPVLGARLTNLAKRKRRAWVDVAIPIAHDQGFPVLNFRPLNSLAQFPAVRGAKIGRHGVLYHVAMAFDEGGQTIEGTLDLPVSGQPVPQFSPSPWVSTNGAAQSSPTSTSSLISPLSGRREGAKRRL